jgi:transketolase
MPSWELFAAQHETYRQQILPPRVGHRIAVEAGSPIGWHRWVGERGEIVAVEGFGASAPAEALAVRFGFTVESIVDRARIVLNKSA